MKFLNKSLILKLLGASALVTHLVASNYFPELFERGLNIFTSEKSIISDKNKELITLLIGEKYIDVSEAEVSDESVIKSRDGIDIFTPGIYNVAYTKLAEDGTTVEVKRTVIVKALSTVLPEDTNLEFSPKKEEGYLYFADPQPSENGENRVIRVDYKHMKFNEENDSITLTEDAYLLEGETHSNPHSVDRAGKTNKFYVRTQNAYSFDVIAVEEGKLEYIKTVPLSFYIEGEEVQYAPRAFGAYNGKYNIQLVSGTNASSRYTMVGIVDVQTDEVIKHIFKSVDGEGSLTSGHAKWLDVDHFAVIDRGNHSINVYRIFTNEEGELDAKHTGSVDTISAVHSIERVAQPKSQLDLDTFYAMGESAEINGTQNSPFAMKLIFDAQKGELRVKPCDIAKFTSTNYCDLKKKDIPATTHHTNFSLDGKHLIVPVYDGKIYKLDRVSMQVVETVDTGVEKGLGAAHVEFSSSLELAVVTNHWSPYITIIDVSNDTFKLKGYVKIYRDAENDIYDSEDKHLMQPHFAEISEDGKYFYTFASQDNGRFVRVNLEEVILHEVDEENIYQFDNNNDHSKTLKSVDVEGAPEQAHS